MWRTSCPAPCSPSLPRFPGTSSQIPAPPVHVPHSPPLPSRHRHPSPPGLSVSASRSCHGIPPTSASSMANGPQGRISPFPPSPAAATGVCCRQRHPGTEALQKAGSGHHMHSPRLHIPGFPVPVRPTVPGGALRALRPPRTLQWAHRPGTSACQGHGTGSGTCRLSNPFSAGRCIKRTHIPSLSPPSAPLPASWPSLPHPQAPLHAPPDVPPCPA